MLHSDVVQPPAHVFLTGELRSIMSSPAHCSRSVRLKVANPSTMHHSLCSR